MTERTTETRGTTAHGARRAPPLGGFNLTALRLEVRRMLRSRRTLMFVLVFPGLFFLIFGTGGTGPRATPMARAYLLISMAVYGAMSAMTASGASVAVERSLGWSRQLRLTPLRPAAYIAMKVATAMVLGLVAVTVAYAVGAATGVRMEPRVWILSGLAAWLASLVFAAFGLFMGFLLPSENVMQFVGPMLALLAMFGGLFVPLPLLPPALRTVAAFTPVYGVGQLARAPLVGGLTAGAIVSVAGWTLAFGAAAASLFARDTTRV
ncbi:ABC-2 type transporter (plasmid) [Gemmatirosa kalamazoonensis]|uniref:ABC-2 type transporter n=1 Tax=Gemmatirosa kalamazoonensis TaxID=861299 RepID=W0RRH4_9BACT|nr:ABC transporter permease [Gemmatirosa kalamazoonensis]AHG93286.1 ABC-2 type transporter [Gemmatirosa kalamazoonensis]